MKKYYFVFTICILSSIVSFSQNYITEQKPYIYQVFCNPKNPYITVKANGLNGVYIGCSVELIVGTKTQVIDLPVQFIKGDSKVAFYVNIKHYNFGKAYSSQQIIYSYTLSLWTDIIRFENFNINDPSTYKMSGLIQGSKVNSLCR